MSTPAKNLFYCHGWSQGRDLLRFVQVSHHLSFRHSLAYLQQQSDPPADPAPASQRLFLKYLRQ